MKQKHSEFEKKTRETKQTTRSPPKETVHLGGTLLIECEMLRGKGEVGLPQTELRWVFWMGVLLPNHWVFNVVRNLHSLTLTNNP